MIRFKNSFDPPEEEQMPRCPVCGCDCDYYFIYDDAIVGCENCVEKKDAFDYREDHE